MLHHFQHYSYHRLNYQFLSLLTNEGISSLSAGTACCLRDHPACIKPHLDVLQRWYRSFLSLYFCFSHRTFTIFLFLHDDLTTHRNAAKAALLLADPTEEAHLLILSTPFALSACYNFGLLRHVNNFATLTHVLFLVTSIFCFILFQNFSSSKVELGCR